MAFSVDTTAMGKKADDFANLSRLAPQETRRVLGNIALELERKAKRIAIRGAGGVFKGGSGGIKKSLRARFVGDDTILLTTGVVYGRIQDKGGTTKPHVIRAKPRPYMSSFSWRKGKTVARKTTGRTGGMLAFMLGGVLTFRKEVHHPGSRIPATDYSGKSWEATKDYAYKALRNIGEFIRKGGRR